MDLCFLTIHRAGHLMKENQGSTSSTIIFDLLAFKGPLKGNIFFLTIKAVLPEAWVNS